VGICDGWTVVELGAGSVAGALAGMMFADNGARVLKVEPPDGDRLRTLSPSGSLVWNRGKESVVADLRTDTGREQAQSLATTADVVLEGFSAGTADRWGLGYDQLHAVNPALVYCSVKGFGSTGRYAGLKAYDAIVEAKAGIFARGDFGFRPGPIFAGALLASNGAAHMAVSSVLAALIAREQTGRGQLVEATMVQGLNALDYFNTMHWQYAQRTGEKGAVVLGGAALAATRYWLMHCTKDSRFIMTVPQLPHQAKALIRAAGVEYVLDDPRYAHVPAFATADDAQAWEDLMWDVFRQKTLEEWLPILRADPDIPFEVAVTSEEGLDHPQMVHNGHVVTVEDPELGPVRELGPLAAFSRTPSRIERSAPRLGSHAPTKAPPSPVAGEGPAPAHPLSGITIVELGYFFAMPFGVTLAASLGARVIKVEGLEGDPMRASFGARETGAVKTMEGKESIAVDVSTTAGQAVVHKLAEKADAFVFGFRPGVDKRLKLDYETLSKINPRLVYVFAAGYGTTGPYSHRPMYASAASAAAGSFHRQAGYWLDPDLLADYGVPELQAIVAPRLRGPVDGDTNAALAVCSALLFGLAHQRRTGEGQFVETSMIGSNAFPYSDDFNSYAGKPPARLADEEQYGLHALYRLYETETGWVFLAAPTQGEWERLAATIARTDLLDDDRFSAPDHRLANDEALVTELAKVFAARPATEWEERLTAAGVGCAEAFEGGHSAFTCTDPVMKETGLVLEVDHPIFGRIVRHGLPAHFSETPGRVAPSCLLGEHTDRILGEFGYAADEIARLKEAKVVAGLAT
jgi:crotonobetainyl-CoA:carnitine CoA-transferase CaiB-like acyl-CoA transferase